jgi:hypothetical protein
LNAMSLGGYAGSPGDTLDAISAGTRNGAFGTVTGAFAQPVTALYGPAGIQITLAPQGTNAWNNDNDGNWSDPNNWNLGHAPLAGEDVLLDRPARLVNITYAGGNPSVRSLINRENLIISSGTLDLAQTSSLGMLTVSGGTLCGAGDKVIDALTMTSGAIAGSGNVSVTQSFVQSGGAITIGGALDVNQSIGALDIGGTVNAASIRYSAPDSVKISAPQSANGNFVATATSGSVNIAAPVSGANVSVDALQSIQVNGTVNASGDIAFATQSGDLLITSNVAAANRFVASVGGQFDVRNASVQAPTFDIQFPGRGDGGIFVNGQGGVLSQGSSGFYFANGVPAVFGPNFNVRYAIGSGPGVLIEPVRVEVTQSIVGIDRLPLRDLEKQFLESTFKERETATEPDPKDLNKRRERAPQQCS